MTNSNEFNKHTVIIGYRPNKRQEVVFLDFLKMSLGGLSIVSKFWKLRYSIRAVSGAPLSSSGLEEALQKWSE